MIKITPALLALCMGVSARAATGTAVIRPTAEGSTLSGTVKFEDTTKGLKVSVELSGVPAGEHGFHVHEFGVCEDAGKAAGSHYNPLKTPHGDVVKDGVHKAHAGDMGSINAGADGKVVLEVVIPKLALTGAKNSAAGRAVIVHEKKDDMSQPVGNAGARIGCGVIAITGQ